jgi:hypothetical protein
MILPLALVSVVSAAGLTGTEASGVVQAMKAHAAAAKQARSADAAVAADVEAFEEEAGFTSDCGALGEQCAGPVETVVGAQVVEPVNRGFLGLGPAGTKGEIDGPMSRGNGSYTVEKNDAFELQFTMNTGYIKAQFTVTRDQATGADTMHFKGKLYKDGKWTEDRDVTYGIQISYDSGQDRGKIRWKENGKWKEEGFWGGRAGSKKMTIEFGGGYDHDFTH